MHSYKSVCNQRGKLKQSVGQSLSLQCDRQVCMLVLFWMIGRKNENYKNHIYCARPENKNARHALTLDLFIHSRFFLIHWIRTERINSKSLISLFMNTLLPLSPPPQTHFGPLVFTSITAAAAAENVDHRRIDDNRQLIGEDAVVLSSCLLYLISVWQSISTVILCMSSSSAVHCCCCLILGSPQLVPVDSSRISARSHAASEG